MAPWQLLNAEVVFEGVVFEEEVFEERAAELAAEESLRRGLQWRKWGGAVCISGEGSIF